MGREPDRALHGDEEEDRAEREQRGEQQVVARLRSLSPALAQAAQQHEQQRRGERRRSSAQNSASRVARPQMRDHRSDHQRRKRRKGDVPGARRRGPSRWCPAAVADHAELAVQGSSGPGARSGCRRWGRSARVAEQSHVDECADHEEMTSGSSGAALHGRASIAEPKLDHPSRRALSHRRLALSTRRPSRRSSRPCLR